jgi:hypothetical protein
MSIVESFLIGAILWIVHFLQTPEGQAILTTTENEIIAELEAVQAGQPGTTPPQQPPAQPTPPVTGQSIPFNPRKQSSVVGEQPLAGG